MNNHKIAYLSCSNSWGGLEMNQLRNALWMKERGHEVVLVVLPESRIAKEAKANALPYLEVKPYKKYFDVISAYRLSRLFSSHRITHLIVRNPHDMSLAALVKRFLGSKLFYAYFMEMQLGISKKDFLHTMRFKAIDLWSCPLPWLVNQVRDKTKFPQARIVEIPSMLSVKALQSDISKQEARALLKLPKQQVIFGLIGRFDKQKGQHLLLEAYSKLPKVYQQKVALCFLGEKTVNEADDYYETLLELIKKEKLENHVFIRPFRKDIATFFKAIDATIMASKAETFGMVTIESMACGTPVIGSNAGGTPELLNFGEHGLLFEPLNSTDLCQKLIEFLEQRPAWEKKDLTNIAFQYDTSNVLPKVEKALQL